MANRNHLAKLRQGVDAWNLWRAQDRSIEPDLSKVDLRDAVLEGANLNLADFRGSDLRSAKFANAQLDLANFTAADLSEADLRYAVLMKANLTGVSLRKANLKFANLIDADLTDADLTGALVYGTSVWNVTLERTKQDSLVITPYDQLEVTVDRLEVAQFVYLLLSNEKIRDVIDTVGRTGVLLLGRFRMGRVDVLNRLREELRKRGFVPMVFDFDRPETKDLTETVRLLAGMSHFVIVDLTMPKSVPLELQAIVPNCMVPFVPILEEGEEPFAMFDGLWNQYRDRMLEPLCYSSVDRLIELLDSMIIQPAQAMFADLVAAKAQKVSYRHV